MNPLWPASVDDQSAQPQVVTLTLGIFFDGTGNNALNARRHLGSLLEDGEALAAWKHTTKQTLGFCDSAIGSHIGYYTNIYWLHSLYVTESAGSQHQQSLYIDGIGTQEGEADSVLNMAFGTGDQGIVAKTDRAVALLVGILHRYALQHPNQVINELQFDLFGFSRGAAAARHFANRLFNQDSSIIEAIKKGLEGVHYRGSPAGKTRFLGLFDTVAAVATLANGLAPHSADSGDVNLALRPGVAEKVFHLTAQHECRFNFALNSVQPAWPEVALPGVHSDIGGGYHAVEQETCFLTRPQLETVPLATADEETRVYQAASKALDAMRDYPAIAPYIETGEVALRTWFDDRMPADRYGTLQKRSGAAVVLQRTVRNDWAKVALRVMIDAAQAAGVRFNAIEGADKALTLPAEMLPLYEKALALSRAVRCGRKPIDFSKGEIALLAARYLHGSANWNEVQTDAGGNIVDAVRPVESGAFVHRPDTRWQRTVYDLNGKKMT
ncbi:DUF2235 domain-containing protein [Erwinia sp.]|uniref:DUF2235 domain-containing protein n=1 Tax=Erwinia citreus TaxID=558 RepID=UPI002897EE23|nr:DUF2235 domain-containing protein [Erwinia sp.]